jgi:hypothetical protein
VAIFRSATAKRTPLRTLFGDLRRLRSFYKTTLQNLTTLVPEKLELKKRISVPFYPAITNKLQKILKPTKIIIIYSSADYKLKRRLGTTKDPKITNDKSGIYEIKCGTWNCQYKYIGQTRRSIKTRLKEQLSHTNNNHTNLSSVAHHMKIKLNGSRRM